MSNDNNIAGMKLKDILEDIFPNERLTIASFSNEARSLHMREIENSLFIGFRVGFEYFDSFAAQLGIRSENIAFARTQKAIKFANSKMPSEMIQGGKLILAFRRQHRIQLELCCLHLACGFSIFLLPPPPTNPHRPSHITPRKATIASGRHSKKERKTEP